MGEIVNDAITVLILMKQYKLIIKQPTKVEIYFTRVSITKKSQYMNNNTFL